MCPVLCIHVGQAGIRIGTALWELLCFENGIRPDGQMAVTSSGCGGYDALFTTSGGGCLTARAVMVDLDPSLIDEVRNGPYRYLFSPNSLISGREDAANNYARGYYSVGRQLIDEAVDKIRYAVEDSPFLQGMLIFRSFGGGTGSGFTALLLERLAADYGLKSKTLFSVYPAPQFSSVIVEPYNAILTTHACMSYEDCSFLLDNEAVYNILGNLNSAGQGCENANRIIAQVISTITVSEITGAVTNLVPFPRLHFPILSYAPFLGKNAGAYQTLTTRLAKDCFEQSNQLVKCDLRHGKFLSCCLFFRGAISPSDANNSLKQIKADQSLKFVDWAPSSFKVALSYREPAFLPWGDLAPSPQAVCMMCNSTAITEAFSRLLKRYKTLCKKRAFFHHYVGEGMEESEFRTAGEDVASLINEYKAAEEQPKQDDEEDDDDDDDESKTSIQDKKSTNKEAAK